MLFRSMTFAATIAAFALIAPANATTLVTGSNPLSGTSVAAEPWLAGTIVADTLDPYTISNASGTLSATVQSRVVLAVDGTYDFYWRITDVSFQPVAGFDGAALSISALRIGNFGASVVGDNANYRTDGLGEVAPSSALVFNPATNFVNFMFGNPVTAGETSYFMFLDTNATHYSRNALLDLASNQPISGEGSTFGPAGVPEPASWALMILGFGGIGAAMRRRARPAVRFG